MYTSLFLRSRLFLPLLLPSLLLLAPLFAAAAEDTSDAMREMAGIMHRLKHFPSPQGKAALQRIADDPATTATERIIARAMMNLQHRAMDVDRPGLERIMQDPKASADERDLAAMVYRLDHRPTAQDKARLQSMMEGRPHAM